MSAVDAWMPLYIGDYLADTRRLTTVEHGAYILLLMEQWRRGWVPDDEVQLSRITGLRLDHWRKAAGNLLPYFDAGDMPGTLRQKRLHAEREKALGISAKRADAARAKAASAADRSPERNNTEGGGGSGRKSTHVTTPDFAPKPLEKQEPEPANAEQMQVVCTHNHNHSHLVSKKEYPPAAFGVGLPQGGTDGRAPAWGLATRSD
jgi:uncharacterized protein YdaU (DUF1376 family)